MSWGVAWVAVAAGEGVCGDMLTLVVEPTGLQLLLRHLCARVVSRQHDAGGTS